MRIFLLLSALTVATGRADEPPASTMRQKLSSKVKEAVSQSPPPKQSADAKADENAISPAIVMKPVVVSESKIVREVAAAIARKEQEEREERFSALNGGKIGKIGGMQLGGWWSAGEG